MEQRFALLLGNSLYDDATLARLSAPQGDAADFAAVLEDPEIGGFSQVSTLINQPANEIRKGIARFFANRNRDDLLLLYFSGHGVLDDRGRLFLASKDSEHDLLNATAIDAAFITDAMDRSRSTRQILILDCCHSGAFARGSKGALGSSVGTAAAFEGTGSGRVILTATDATQYAWEGEKIIGAAENSVFTHHLVEGLRSGHADRDEDGWIALDEWFDYVYDRVVEETPKQTPGKWSYKQQGEIWIARNPHPLPPRPVLPQELMDTIADPRSWVREGAVAELDRLLRSGSPNMTSAARAALEALVNDDSRRVSSAAELILAGASSADQKQPAAAEAKAAVARPEAEIAPDSALSVQTGWIKPDQVESIPPDQHSGSPSASQTRVNARKSLEKILSSPAAIIAIAWCFGAIANLFIAWIQDNTTGILIGWAVAGLIADLGTWRLMPEARFSRVPLLTLGWPLGRAITGALYLPVYSQDTSFGAGGALVLTVSYLMIWVLLASLLAALRALTVSPGSNPKQTILKAIACWEAVFIFSLLLTGVQSQEAGFRYFYDNPHSVIGNLENSLAAYFGLGLNEMIIGIIGSYLWSMWAHLKE